MQLTSMIQVPGTVPHEGQKSVVLLAPSAESRLGQAAHPVAPVNTGSLHDLSEAQVPHL